MPFLFILLLAALNFFTLGLRKPGVFEDLPRAFASSEKGAQVGGSRDLLLIAAGQRAFAANFAMIDMLVYYGTHEHGGETHEEHLSAGEYLDLFPMTKRVMALDPYFRQAIFYGSAALAFNEGRDEQAVQLLQEARSKDPANWQYPLILSAIAYKKSGDVSKIIKSLEPVAELTECPTMLKNILSNLYLKTGQKAEAVRILRIIMETAPEEDYRRAAGKKLSWLGAL